MEPFLAHDGIAGGEPWREALRDEIDKCNMLVALVTKNFHASEFTGQEVGAAWVLQKPVLCVCVDGAAPAGFVAERQGFKYDHADPDRMAADMLTFAMPKIYGERAADTVVEMLPESASLLEVECLTNLLEREDLTAEHLKTIESALVSNPYIQTSIARPKLDKLLRKHTAG